MFPDVPFDETLFDSNEMMRNYWDRATDKRPAFESADARADEPDHELVELTYGAYDNVAALLTNNMSDKKDPKVHVKKVFGRVKTVAAESSKAEAAEAKATEATEAKALEALEATEAKATEAPEAAETKPDSSKQLKATKSEGLMPPIFGLIVLGLIFWVLTRSKSRT